MRARKLVVVGLVVAAVGGFLTYSCVSRTDDTEDVASPAASTTVAVPTTTVAPTDVVTIEPSAVSSAAEEAARQGLTVAFTWYPATDATQNDAYGRARTWLTSTLAARMIVDASTERGPGRAVGGPVGTAGSEGHRRCQHRMLRLPPEDTDTVVHRVATIKQTAVAGNTTDTVKPDTTVWVTIVREGDRWLIDDIRY